MFFIDRKDIIEWRARYLEGMLNYCGEGQRILYLDETWVNPSHKKNKR